LKILTFLILLTLIGCSIQSSSNQTKNYGFLKPTENDLNNCSSPPEGMVCVPASNYKIGNSNVFINTFYADKFEISNDDYEKCVKNKSCKTNVFLKSKNNQKFSDPKQPAIGLSYTMAHDYCTFKGKRLPTESEWNKLYSLYAISKKEPFSCSNANIKGCFEKTTPIGNFPNPYGVHDLEGNVSEWVNEWADSCGENCIEKKCNICQKSQSTCSGKFPCEKYTPKYNEINWNTINLDGIRNSLKGEKLQLMKVKGTSFEDNPSSSPESSSKIGNINDVSTKYGARCISDTIYLNKSPAWMVSNPPNINKDLNNLDPAKQSTFQNLKEYDSINDKPLCKELFTSPANCRDPMSYTKPNEARNYLFAPYVKNLRGGYIGVAADANYTFLTYAKSEYVWLMDFNMNIVNLHKINKVFILDSPQPQDFLKKWSSPNRTTSLKLLEATLNESPEWENIKKFFNANQSSLHEHYTSLSYPDKTNGDFGWLRNNENYEYLRKLHQTNRISIVEGDLLKDKTLFNIGETAKKLNIKIRILYPSNAEEFWKFSEIYKRNILNLPFDEASIVVRTVHEFQWHNNEKSKGSLGFWHYVVHGAYNYQKKLLLSDFYLIDHFKNYRVFPNDLKDFSTIELPEKIPEGLF
jgi:hypothetical protein